MTEKPGAFQAPAGSWTAVACAPHANVWNAFRLALGSATETICTPDFFLFDSENGLAYRGRLDETRPKTDAKPHGRDVRAALDEVAAGRAPTGEQHPSVGCNIKWKSA
jgi:hypothetical protein